MKKALFIDGSSLIFRAFYAIRNLSTRDGVPTGAVYGFINMFESAVEKIKPDYILVAFDNPGPTIRTKQFAEYKGNREKTPDELITQFGIVKDLLDSYKVKHYALDDYEADDIIGTISRKATEKGIESYMLTGDRDYFQLVDDRASVLYTKKGISNLEFYNLEKIENEYGLKPKELIDVKGLMGDTSDNIPGVPGVGEKTAIKLIKEYGNIEGVYENIDKISGKVLPKNLEENKNLAFMSRSLGTIFTNIDLDFDIEDLKCLEPNNNELYEKFKVLEFNTLTKKFASDIEDSRDFNFNIVGINRMADIYNYIVKTQTLIFDIICDEDYLIYTPKYIAIKGNNNILIVDLDKEKKHFVEKFKSLFEDLEIKKVGFDIKKMMILLKKIGINLRENYLDLMLVSYLINPKGNYSIKDISISELEKDIKDLEEYLGKGKNKKQVEDLELVYVEEYLANNLLVIENTKDKLLKKLKDLEMTHLLEDIELPLIKVLADMEIFGIKVNKEEFEKLDVEISNRIENLEIKIYELAGEQFNINSPKQLGEILFEKLKLPVIKKTKTGYSTNVDVLDKLYNEHEIISLILEYRQIAKLKSTYIDGMLMEISEDGKIHSKFNQTVTATGRLSSTEPNLQNIPIRTEEGRLIRKAFVAGKNHKLISADYSQIELRVLAALSKDENMLDAFKHGIDIHTKTASEVFHVDLKDVTKLQRSEAKAVNFGIVYGISDYGLSEDLKISRKRAKEYIEKYLNSYPKISEYMENIVKKAKEEGFVETIFHRRRYIPELKSSNFNIRSFGERIALNTPIQGSAADIIKIAMIHVYNRLKKEKLQAKLILQIHDELIIECPDEELDKVINVLREEMENAVNINVSLIAEVEYGDNWYEI